MDGPAATSRCAPSPPLSDAPWSKRLSNLALTCLQNRTIWFLGNSVARHWAFVLSDMLTGVQLEPRKLSSMGMEVEKRLCGRGGVFAGRRSGDLSTRLPVEDATHLHAERSKSGRAFGDDVPITGMNQYNCFGICECRLQQANEILGSGQLLFGWTFRLDNPHVGRALVEGLPGKSPAPDVVVLNAGQPRDACPVCADAGQTTLESIEVAAPWLSARVSEARRRNPALRFYWRSSTAICNATSESQIEQLRHHPKGARMWGLDASRLNPMVRALNERTERHLCRTPGVQVIDGFAWTEGRCDEYDDAHHHSRLTFGHVATFLRHECGLPL